MQRARYITLETIAPLSNDLTVSLPPLGSLNEQLTLLSSAVATPRLGTRSNSNIIAFWSRLLSITSLGIGLIPGEGEHRRVQGVDEAACQSREEDVENARYVARNGPSGREPAIDQTACFTQSS